MRYQFPFYINVPVHLSRNNFHPHLSGLFLWYLLQCFELWPFSASILVGYFDASWFVSYFFVPVCLHSLPTFRWLWKWGHSVRVSVRFIECLCIVNIPIMWRGWIFIKDHFDGICSIRQSTKTSLKLSRLKMEEGVRRRWRSKWELCETAVQLRELEKSCSSVFCDFIKSQFELLKDAFTPGWDSVWGGE